MNSNYCITSNSVEYKTLLAEQGDLAGISMKLDVCANCIHIPLLQGKDICISSADFPYCPLCGNYTLTPYVIGIEAMLESADPCDCDSDHPQHNNGGNYHYTHYRVMDETSPRTVGNAIWMHNFEAYLIENGYTTEDIEVICADLGQYFALDVTPFYAAHIVMSPKP